MKRYIRFLIAGSIGFAVDAGVLSTLLHSGTLDAFSARAVAIACALCCTWMFNRNFTFDKTGRPLVVEGARYGGVGISTALVNYGLYSGILLAAPHVEPLVALVVSSGCATILSYNGYSRFVFRD